MAVSTGCRRVSSNESDTSRSCCLVSQSLGTYIREVLTFFFTAEVALSTCWAEKVTEKVIGTGIDGLVLGVEVVEDGLDGVDGGTELPVLVPVGWDVPVAVWPLPW